MKVGGPAALEQALSSLLRGILATMEGFVLHFFLGRNNFKKVL